jgi:phenylpropionate dioxygenase-like ring-hydroxylating dioxygenase large terminal subunit
MISKQWYVVLESSEVKVGKPVGVTRMGERLVFWRDSQGKVVCMRDLCPHLGAQLSQGKVMHGTIACPFHGFQYDSSGICTYLPAFGKGLEPPKAMHLVSYPVWEAHGYIFLWWHDGTNDKDEGLPEKLVEPDFFDDLDHSGFSKASFHQHWATHYSRVVENQLDVMHLPFVHFNTIGRGGRSVVDGPLVELEGNTINLWVFNRRDDGVPPRKADELDQPSRPPFLIFKFPNLWQNRISEDFRLVVAFVPVDEENTILYGRIYQRVVRVPLLREMMNLAAVIGSDFIARQDRRIVPNQRPKKTGLKIGEKPIQGDRAIITYRRRRFELQQSAEKREI